MTDQVLDEIAALRSALGEVSTRQAATAAVLEEVKQGIVEKTESIRGARSKAEEAINAGKNLDGRFAGLESNLKRSEQLFGVVKFIGTVVVIIAGALTFIGFRSLSDLEARLEKKIESAVSREFLKNGTSVSETKKQYDDLQGVYKGALAQIEWAEKITRAYDQNKDEFEAAKNMVALRGLVDVNVTPKNQPGSQQAEEVYSILLGAVHNEEKDPEMKQRRYDPNLLFNAAKVANRFGFSGLAYQLSERAWRLEPSPAHKASFWRLKAERREPGAADELYGMVRDLGLQSPEHVLAEAWNISENDRSYDLLIAAIDARVAKQGSAGETEYLPSYIHAIKAHALTRRGDPDSLVAAVRELARARELQKTESTEATWYDPTTREIEQVEEFLPDASQAKNEQHQQLRELLQQLQKRQQQQ